MTDEVAALVLADNAGQALALSLDAPAQRRALRGVRGAWSTSMVGGGPAQPRRTSRCPRATSCWRAAQRERGLPRPLLCVLLGYSKMSAFQLLLETDFPDGAAGRPFLDLYFPRLLRERFAEHFQEHVLRREIIATGAVNYLINRGGIALLPRLTRRRRGRHRRGRDGVDRGRPRGRGRARCGRAARRRPPGRGRAGRRCSRSRPASRPGARAPGRQAHARHTPGAGEAALEGRALRPAR